jgi:hypothetical protein
MPTSHKHVKACALTIVLVAAAAPACAGITKDGNVFVVLSQAEARTILSGPVKRAFRLGVKQASKKAA